MSVRVPSVLLSGVVAAVLVASAVPDARQAQSPPAQAPVFRTTTNSIEVDVMVRDDRGAFVHTLTAKDLELYEDGKLQVIEQCYLVGSGAAGQPPVAGGSPIESDSNFHRMFVLVFDETDLETSALVRIRQGAEDFIKANFKDDDYGGVVVNGRLYQNKLTRSREMLLAGIRAVRPAVDSRDARLRPFREFPRIPGEAEAARLALGDRMLLMDLGNQACTEDPAECRAVGGEGQVENKLELKARVYIGQARDATRYTLASIQTVIDALASLPGRKTIVFFSDGFFASESSSQLRQIAGMAARVGATIYGIDGRGLGGGPPQSPDVTVASKPISGGLDTSDNGPFVLANGTGGFVVRHATDIAEALNSIALDTSTYYVVGYRPTNAAMDGKFRKITVKAKAAGLHLRARTGYVASPLPPRLGR